MSATEVVTVIALIVGPILAVLITRWLDDSRTKSARRLDIFRTLMRTRRTPVYPEHVGALNLIEIEFARDKEVIKKWKSLFEHLGTQHVRSMDETVSEGMPPDEMARRNNAFDQRLFKERQSLLAKLLHAMAQELGFKIEQLEIFEGGYMPQGWVDVDTEQRAIRRFIVDLDQGRKIVPVGVINFVSAEKLKEIKG